MKENKIILDHAHQQPPARQRPEEEDDFGPEAAVKDFFFEGVYGQLKRQPAQLVLICEVLNMWFTAKRNQEENVHESIYI